MTYLWCLVSGAAWPSLAYVMKCETGRRAVALCSAMTGLYVQTHQTGGVRHSGDNTLLSAKSIESEV